MSGAAAAVDVPPADTAPPDIGDMMSYQARADAEARAAADARTAERAAKREPPTWAKLEERARALGMALTGPIRSGGIIASAGIERNGVRMAGCQAMDWHRQMPEQQDRILRAQIGAALWVLEGA